MEKVFRSGLSSVLTAIGAHSGLLEGDPRKLRELAHHHFVADGIAPEVVESFFKDIGLPPLQLTNPVVLLGREEWACRMSSGPVQMATISAGGTYLAVAAGMGKVFLVHRKTGEEQCVQGHKGLVRSVCFSIDDSIVYSAGKDQIIRAWSVPDLELVEEFVGHDKQINAISVSPNGAWLASVADDGSVRLWSLDGKESRRLVGHPTWVSDVAWLSDTELISSAADGVMSLWTVEGHGMKPLYGHVHPVLSVAACPKNRIIASGDRSGLIRLWDGDTGQTIESLNGHNGPVSDLAFDSMGHFLMSASGDRSVVLWDTVSRAVLGRFPGHLREVVSVAWSPDDKPTSLAADRIHREWNMASIRPGSRRISHQSGVRSCALAPDGRILSASRDYSIAIWSAGDMVRIGSLEGHEGSVEGMAVLPEGDRLLSVSNDGRMILWDLDTQSILRTIDCEQGPLTGCDVAHSGRMHLSAGRDGTLKVWDGDTGDPWFFIAGHRERIRTCAVHPDGRRIVTGSYDHELRIWEAGNGRCLGVLKQHTGPVIDCALSGDGQDLVAVSMDGTLSFWDMGTGGLVARVEAHVNGAVAVCTLGDSHVVTAGMDGFVRVWNIEHAVCVHHHPIRSGPAALASSGNRLVCGDKQGNLWVFNWAEDCLRPEDWPVGNSRLLDIV
jgi:WD40 repeat protein